MYTRSCQDTYGRRSQAKELVYISPKISRKDRKVKVCLDVTSMQGQFATRCFTLIQEACTAQHLQTLSYAKFIDPLPSCFDINGARHDFSHTFKPVTQHYQICVWGTILSGKAAAMRDPRSGQALQDGQRRYRNAICRNRCRPRPPFSRSCLAVTPVVAIREAEPEFESLEVFALVAGCESDAGLARLRLGPDDVLQDRLETDLIDVAATALHCPHELRSSGFSA